MGLFTKFRNHRKAKKRNKKAAKLAKKEGKWNYKLMKKAQRQQANKDKASYKWAAKSEAYRNGIDPEASKWAGIASLGNSAGQAASSIFGMPDIGGMFGGGSAQGQPGYEGGVQMQGNMMPLMVAGAIGLFLLIKRK